MFKEKLRYLSLLVLLGFTIILGIKHVHQYHHELFVGVLFSACLIFYLIQIFLGNND